MSLELTDRLLVVVFRPITHIEEDKSSGKDDQLERSQDHISTMISRELSVSSVSSLLAAYSCGDHYACILQLPGR